MLFSSLIFIFGFLPICLAAVFVGVKLGGRRAAIPILLLASLIFYAWQTPAYIFLMLGSIIVNFFLGRRISTQRSTVDVAIGIVFNLALLGWFKYIGLFSATLSAISQLDVTIDGVVLPLAISFFTFQQIAYLVDCLNKERSGYGFLDYALFVSFFPQLIAGPIVHHKELAPQFRNKRFVAFRREDILGGLFLFAIGLSKKILIADGVAPIADSVFDAAQAGYLVSMSDAWLGVLAYSFQIYFDFSAYSDMALGLALLLGVRLPMNFNSPYKSHSIVDFWRRWHITLSTFLRDYLYFPLGGNRKGPLMRYRNLFIVMLLGGLWHGAAWTFVVWGGLHGMYLCINHAWEKLFEGRTILGPFIATVLTFAGVALAWVFFRAESFEAAFSVLAALTGVEAAASTILERSTLYSLPVLVIAALVVWRCPNALELYERLEPVFRDDGSTAQSQTSAFQSSSLVKIEASHLMSVLGVTTAIAIFVLLSSGSYEFIYFQF